MKYKNATVRSLTLIKKYNEIVKNIKLVCYAVKKITVDFEVLDKHRRILGVLGVTRNSKDEICKSLTGTNKF